MNQWRTILERDRASLVTAERTSALEEYISLFMNPFAAVCRQMVHESKTYFVGTAKFILRMRAPLR